MRQARPWWVKPTPQDEIQRAVADATHRIDDCYAELAAIRIFLAELLSLLRQGRSQQ